MLASARDLTRKKMAAATLTALLSAGVLTVAGDVAQAQSEEGEVVNRGMQVSENRDYTGLLGPLGLVGLAGLRRKRDDNVGVRRARSTDRYSAVPEGQRWGLRGREHDRGQERRWRQEDSLQPQVGSANSGWRRVTHGGLEHGGTAVPRPSRVYEEAAAPRLRRNGVAGR